MTTFPQANVTYRLFGGDASRQRAETFAEEQAGTVWFVDQLGRDVAFDEVGLDPWGRDDTGLQYDYIAWTHT